MAIERFPCPNCRADMDFDPESGGLKCTYCGTRTEMPVATKATVEENLLDKALLEPDPSRIQRLSAISKEFTCSGCGATVQFEPPLVSGTCPFCAANIVVQPKDSDPLIAPDGVLPFAVPKEIAGTHLRNWLSSLWFAPGALSAMARPEGLRGMYLPFWTFDARTNTSYAGRRGDYYYETVNVRQNVNGQDVVRQVQERRVAWRNASGAVPVDFDDVLVPATRSIAADRLIRLSPWKLENVKPYDAAYLSGFQAQKYQVELEDGFEAGKRMMAGAIESAIRADIGGDEQQIQEVRTGYSNRTFKHLFMPVWLGAYRFEGRVYQIVVNAQTGEIDGERPYSKAKIFALVLLLFVVFLYLIARQGR